MAQGRQGSTAPLSLSEPRCETKRAPNVVLEQLAKGAPILQVEETDTDCPPAGATIVDVIPVTTQRCQRLLTLFSKGFSSFVCTTCALSVSVQYLAFAGVHLRICAAFSNCTTLRNSKRVETWRVEPTGRSPSLVDLSRVA